MSLQHHLPDQVVRADPWTLFCAECSRKMRIMTATPAQDGRETRTYEHLRPRRKDQRGHSQVSSPSTISLISRARPVNRFKLRLVTVACRSDAVREA